MAEKISNATLIQDAAAAILEQDTFFETQASVLSTGDTVLVVAEDQLLLGTVDVNEGTMRTYRFEEISVGGRGVAYLKYAITEQGWVSTPEVELRMPNATFWERSRW